MSNEPQLMVVFIRDDKGYYHLSIDGAEELSYAMGKCNEHPDDKRTYLTQQMLQSIYGMLIKGEHYEALADIKRVAETNNYKLVIDAH